MFKRFSNRTKQFRNQEKNRLATSGEVTLTISDGQATFRIQRLDRWVPKMNHPARQAPLWVAVIASILLLAHPTNVVAAPYTATDIIRLTNVARQKNNVATLRTDQRLTQAAQAKANDMLTKGYFSHTSPDGQSPWTWISQAGYAYTQAGENLAMDFIEAEDVIASWLGSATHRKNLLNEKFRDTGVAVLEGNLNGQSTIIVVQFFGSQHATTPAPNSPTPAASTPTITPTVPVNEPRASLPANPTPTPPPPAEIRIPSLVDSTGRSIPTLTFTFQSPDPNLLQPRTPTPRVEGVQTPPASTQTTPANSAPIKHLPELMLIVLLVDLLAVAGYAYWRQTFQVSYLSPRLENLKST